jgi:hypothetical protein
MKKLIMPSRTTKYTEFTTVPAKVEILIPAVMKCTGNIT